MYRLNPIQPHLNHLIWLMCAIVIAFCALRTPPGPEKKSSGLGCSPVCFLLIDINNMLDIVSKKEVYFRAIFTEVKV